MKRGHPLIAVGTALLLASCTSIHPIAVRETAGPQPAKLYPREGSLPVYRHPPISVRCSTLLALCTSVLPIAVRETAGPQPAKLYPREGSLIVYSATEQQFEGDSTYYPHTDYRIFTRSGRLFKQVRNALYPADETPRTIALPSGVYTVIAESETAGTVSVPVLIRTGRTTELHLEGKKDWTPPLLARESDLVHLPDGQAIGFRAADR